MPLSFKDIGAKSEDIPQLLSMLGVDEQNKSEGKFVVLYKSDCEKICTIAAKLQRTEILASFGALRLY